MAVLDDIPPMPSNRPTILQTFDAAMSFNGGDVPTTITTAGTFDLTGPDGKVSILDMGVGRAEASWVFQISRRATDGDQKYQFILLGAVDGADPNDANNYDILEIVGSGGKDRIGPPGLIGISAPVPGKIGSGLITSYPFVNVRDQICYRWLRLRVTVAGNNPNITFLSWVTYEVT